MAAILWPQFTRNQSAGAGPQTSYSLAGHGWGQLAASLAETDIQDTLRTAGVWSGLYIRVIANDCASSTFNSRKNLAAGSQTVTIGASATGEFEDTTHTDTLADGDKFAWQLVQGAGTQFSTYTMRSVFTATTGSAMRYFAAPGGGVTDNGVTRFTSLVGRSEPDTATEANVQHLVKSTTTFKRLFVSVQTNTRGGTSTARFRKNGGNGNQSIAIGAGVTGVLEDTSNTDACVSGDLVDYSVDYYADGNNLRFREMAVSAVSDDGTGALISATGEGLMLSVGTSVTTNLGFGLSELPTTTEANAQTKFPLSCTLSKANVYVPTNTLTASSTIRMRVGGANRNLVLTIGSGATGRIEDTSNSDSIAAGSEVNWQIVTGGSGTAIGLNNLSVLYAATVYGVRGFGDDHDSIFMARWRPVEYHAPYR